MNLRLRPRAIATPHLACALASLLAFDARASDTIASATIASQPASEQTADCDFDQAHLAQRLRQAAARHGGAKLDPLEKTATWSLPGGETVQVGHGGCVDLGTSVKWVYAKGRPAPTREVAVKRAIEAVATYWSATDARRIEAAYRRGNLQERPVRPGVIELSGPLDPDGFSFEFHIEQSDQGVTVSWQEA